MELVPLGTCWQAPVLVAGNSLFQSMFQSVTGFLTIASHYDCILSHWFILKSTLTVQKSGASREGCLSQLRKCLKKGLNQNQLHQVIPSPFISQIPYPAGYYEKKLSWESRNEGRLTRSQKISWSQIENPDKELKDREEEKHKRLLRKSKIWPTLVQTIHGYDKQYIPLENSLKLLQDFKITFIMHSSSCIAMTFVSTSITVYKLAIHKIARCCWMWN